MTVYWCEDCQTFHNGKSHKSGKFKVLTEVQALQEMERKPATKPKKGYIREAYYVKGFGMKWRTRKVDSLES
jgi:predicted RNA-binding protein with PUA domain